MPKKTIPLRIVGPSYGYGHQSHQSQAPVAQRVFKSKPMFRWIGIHADIPDAYVDRHPTWSFEKTSAAYREKLFDACRKAGVQLCAVTVSSILPLSMRRSTSVNPKYGLHLHLATLISTEIQAKLNAALKAYCHRSHKQAEKHSRTKFFRPEVREMQNYRWGSAIYFTRYTKEMGSVNHLVRTYDKNFRDYLKHAEERGLDLDRVGTSIIHGTFHMRSEAQELQKRKAYLLWKMERVEGNKNLLRDEAAENFLQEFLADPEAEPIDAKASAEPAESQQAKSSLHHAFSQMTSYGVQLGSKYYPVVKQRLKEVISAR